MGDRDHRGALDPVPDGDGGGASGGDEQFGLAEADVEENPDVGIGDDAEGADVLEASRHQPVDPP